MGYIRASVGMGLRSVVQDRAEHIERRPSDRIRGRFIAAQSEVEDGSDGDRVIQPLGRPRRNGASRYPVVEIANGNGNSGQAGEPRGAMKARAGEEDVEARARVKTSVQPAE